MTGFDAFFSVVADLARHATPFFWRNVLRCHAACLHPGPELAIALRYLFMTGFDAFFSVVPEGLSWQLPAGGDPIIVLPFLGVRLEASAEPIRLSRIGSDALRIESGEGSTLTVPLAAVPAGMRFDWLPVGSDGAARLLLNSHLSLFPGAHVAELSAESPEAIGQTAMIDSALELIREADPRLSAQIADGVRWYVPLVSPDPEARRSYTLRDLRGVIFQSPGREPRVVAESIVHEYYHSVLNARMELEPVLAGGDAPQFYSPWREDPRPLSGLLHALFVFGGIAEFSLRAERAQGLADQRGALRDRRRLIVEQCRLGLAQAPVELFTPAGRTLLEGLKEINHRHEVELELSCDRLPEVLVAHQRQWCAANPHLAASVEPFRSPSTIR
jgi:HEXXH motif-containing protein